MISKLRTVFWLGVLMLVVPFIGFPYSWKAVIAIAVGASLITLAIGMRSEYRTLRLKLKEYGQ